MKQYKTPINSFIGGWIIDKNVCKDLITFFNDSGARHYQGMVGRSKPESMKQGIDLSVKKSIDLSTHGSYSAFALYNKQLQICLNKYMDRYPEVAKDYARFDSTVESYNIQKYEPGDGYYKWHCERNNGTSKRCRVFMTYLNNVKNGGTEFKYQKIKIQAKTGLTLIWPSDFTHTHRSIVAKETKYIITGWYNFI